MSEYSNFKKGDDQRVYLDDAMGGKGFYTNKYGNNSISQLNQKIYSYIDKVYGPFGFTYPRGGQSANYDVDVNGEIINSEYISKMVNNYTVFKKFIRENKITDEITFYKLLESKFDDVYHYNGRFFKRETLPILINTTRKGNVNEAKCKIKFAEYATSKGLNISVENPTVEEDVNGIDAKFQHDGRMFTIQIKPFTEFKEVNNLLYFKSAGSLSVGGVNYLMLYSNDKFVLIKNSKDNPIKINGDVFIADKSKVTWLN